jgi:hypothetical protein
MRYARFPVSDRAALPDFFKNLPPGALDFLREGFSKLAELEPKIGTHTLNVVAREVIESGLRASEDILRKVASKLKLTEEQSAPLLSAISMTLSLVPGSDFTAEQFVDEVVRALNLPVSTRPTVLEVAQYAVANRATIREAMRVEELANEHLPSLSYFGTSVDVRLGFDEDKVSDAVPVLLVHIDTDEENQALRFQMTKGDAQQVLEDLKKAVERLEKAEAMARAVTGKKD